MKPISAFILLVSLLALVNLSYERKDQDEYWKSLVKDQPMPKAIAESLVQDPPARTIPETTQEKKHFVEAFDTKPTYQSYRTHGDQLMHVSDEKDHFARWFETKSTYQPYGVYSTKGAQSHQDVDGQKDHFARDFETKSTYQPYGVSRNKGSQLVGDVNGNKDHFAHDFDTKPTYGPYSTGQKEHPDHVDGEKKH